MHIFKDGDWVYDPRWEEVFNVDLKRDRMILD